jgi:hypothetical protein
MFPLTSPTTLIFCLSSAHFLIALCSCFDLSHFIIVHFAWCQCDHTIDDLDTNLFQCPYKSECTSIHNTLLNIVAAITLESGHLFPHHIRWWMDILITRDGIHTLMDIVIVDSHRYNVTNINNNNTCNDDCCLGENMILHWTSTRW